MSSVAVFDAVTRVKSV